MSMTSSIVHSDVIDYVQSRNQSCMMTSSITYNIANSFKLPTEEGMEESSLLLANFLQSWPPRELCVPRYWCEWSQPDEPVSYVTHICICAHIYTLLYKKKNIVTQRQVAREESAKQAQTSTTIPKTHKYCRLIKLPSASGILPERRFPSRFLRGEWDAQEWHVKWPYRVPYGIVLFWCNLS